MAPTPVIIWYPGIEGEGFPRNGLSIGMQIWREYRFSRSGRNTWCVSRRIGGVHEPPFSDVSDHWIHAEKGVQWIMIG